MDARAWQAWAAPLGPRSQPLVLDGGLASTLEADGHDLSGSAAGRLWSARLLAEDPAAVAGVADRFLRAGADIVATCTYQASRLRFCQACACKDEEADDLMRSGVAIALRAVDDFWSNRDLAVRGVQQKQQQERPHRRKPIVALSLGPYGAFLGDGSEYHGQYATSDDDIYRFHKDRAEALFGTRLLNSISGKPGHKLHSTPSLNLPDVVAFETIPVLTEALLLVRMMRDRDALLQLPFWISFQCRNSTMLASGDDLCAVVARLLVANAGNRALIGIGINCVPPFCISSLVRIVRGAIIAHMKGCERPWPLRVFAYPNSGEEWDPNRSCWHWQSQQLPVRAWAEMLLDSGADVVGGCCRCGPEYIDAVRDLITERANL